MAYRLPGSSPRALIIEGELKMKSYFGIASVSVALALSAQLVSAAEAAATPAKGCGPSVTEGLSKDQLAKMTDATRAVALKFFKSNPDEQDKLLTPDARIWSLGIGEIDRSKWVELHNPKAGGSDRGKPLSHKQAINYVTVEGDRAAVDMENYVVFKDFTYDQKYHNLVVVRDGKVCLLKIFANSDMGKKLLPDIEDYARKK
jgi:hypothetical protein